MSIDTRTGKLTTQEDVPESTRGRPALICVFPTARALPVPVPNDAIGRDWLARFGVVDEKVSRAHLQFNRSGGVPHVIDVGSSNGTWVNAYALQPKEPVRLHDGDVIRAGRSLFVYRERYMGGDDGAPPLGGLIAPFGLAEERLELHRVISRSPQNILIQGETGTGKELIAAEIAKRLHLEKKFVPVNVAGVAPTIFESQMFGHVRGAFTGADRDSSGIFGSHDGGAVFLDEIGDLALELQARLLRLLDNREILPVGATAPRKVNVVIIAATHRDLETMVSEGKFRQDLLARLQMEQLYLPALRERREDIFAIASDTIAKRGVHWEPAAVQPDAVERLLLYSWKTNVRGLIAAVTRIASIVAPPALTRRAVDKVLGPPESAPSSVVDSARARAVVDQHSGNKTKAAHALGISRGRLLRLLDK